MKEQIEKMAEVLRRCCDNSSKEYCNGFIDCELCEATLLCNEGWRKPSEGEWKWISDDDVICSACGKVFYTADNADAGLSIWSFCPNCGAKMKGADT